MALMNYIFICVSLKYRPKLFGIFARPLAASVLMGAAAWAIYGLCSRFIGAASWSRIALCMLVAIAVAVAVYLVSTIALRSITKEDMKLIPGGEKIANFLHIR